MIIVQDVYKSFRVAARTNWARHGKDDGLFHALSGLSFECRPGRITALLGTNGAGKTTLLRLIAGVNAPSSGTITVEGFDTREQEDEARRRTGFLSGDTKLYDRLMPEELIRYYAELDGMDEAAIQARREALFTSLSINEFAERRIGKLSTGEKRKVLIARAMLNDPEVAVFDGPFEGIDGEAVRHIAAFIRECRAKGKIVLFSTHVADEAGLLADDLVILHRGKLRFAGPFSDFQSQMKSPSIEEEFIGFVSAKPGTIHRERIDGKSDPAGT